MSTPSTNPTRVFSTGKLYAAPYQSSVVTVITSITANTFEGYRIGDVQDATANFAFGEHLSYTDAATNRFPMAVGYHEAKGTMEFTVRDLNPLLLTQMQGIKPDYNINTGLTTYVMGPGTKPMPFALFFAMQDKDDTTVGYVYLPCAYSAGFTSTLKLTDFADQKLTIQGIADVNSKGICACIIEPGTANPNAS